MTCGLMSLRSARPGARPRLIARPPQKGSTRRLCAWAAQMGRRCGTCQRLPPAHLSGGRNGSTCSAAPPGTPRAGAARATGSLRFRVADGFIPGTIARGARSQVSLVGTCHEIFETRDADVVGAGEIPSEPITHVELAKTPSSPAEHKIGSLVRTGANRFRETN